MSILRKVTKVLSKRPGKFVAYSRQYLLFLITGSFLRIFPPPGVVLKSGVRVQKRRSLFAERSNATIRIDKGSIIYEHSRIEAFGAGEVIIGKNCIVGDLKLTSRSRVELGNEVLVSWGVRIQDFESHPRDPALRSEQVKRMASDFSPFSPSERVCKSKQWDYPTEPIAIGDNVWIGMQAIVLKGVKIGAGSVVAAGAVVCSGNYPPNSILAGNPARVAKDLN